MDVREKLEDILDEFVYDEWRRIIMPDLKPCPFCRGEARWNEKNKAPQCSKCLATIPSGGGIFRKWFDESGYREYMAALWNRRAGEEDKHENYT